MEHDPATPEQWSVHVHADNDLTIRDAHIAGRDLTMSSGPARAGGAESRTGRFPRRVRPAAVAAVVAAAFTVLLLAAIGLAVLLGGR